MLVDSHCHLDFPDLANRMPDVLQRMQDNDVGVAVCIGVNLEDFPNVLALAEQHAQLYATVGVHPEYTDVEEPDEARLVALAKHPKVIAIGETGLDYYWHKDQPEWQRERFRTHIRAARRCNKPLVVHTRDSAADTLRVLKDESADAVGVTFKNATIVKDVAQKCPLDRILVETDSPYLAPVPFRGKPNEPAYVRHVAEEIAKLRSISIESVHQATTDNFYSLFQHARKL